MKDQLIDVDVFRIERRDTPDPLSVYWNAAKRFGPEQVFILESLSGPSRDRKATIVGLEPIFEISMNEDHAKFTGAGQLCVHISDVLKLAGYSVDDNHLVKIANSEAAWRMLRTIQSAFKLSPNAPTSLAFFGYFSYDCVRMIENIPTLAPQSYEYPIISLSMYQTLIYFHNNGTTEILINNNALWQRRARDDLNFLMNKQTFKAPHYPEAVEESRMVSKEQFLHRVATAMEHIRSGDVYQIQLGHEIRVRSTVTPFEVYQTLRQRNPSPYMYLAHVGGIDLIGASPELFVRIKDNLIEMRPIAGTIGKKAGTDSTSLVLELTRSEKERAEHLMLIDLCRNDIGRVCQPGSLDVDEFMLVEEYSHLFHMVSNVRGLLRPGLDAYDAIKASFPAGTMSGAPKVRAMELIEELESNRRGIYAGALGLIGFDGNVNTALCIRSTVHDQGTYQMRASAGVVADSIPEAEWLETFYKMGSVYYAITGKEITQ
ncbi:MAG: anthranilate synthase component I family protein [Pseudomonas sp.]|uniref:anthranilate synthase component I family protein n=1 Tax=Pseudomonas sp. TaxID=306 RepID=UPI003D6DD708